jgi:hypothetical protein
MTYKRFYKALRIRLGWKGLGGTYGGQKDVQWISNEENYSHLHLMAKNNAVAAVTMDISDPASVAQLRHIMNNVAYTEIGTDEENTRRRVLSRGVQIENFYLSNILYYLNHSDDDVKAAMEQGKKPVDFTGNEISPENFAKVLENLRSLVADDASVLRFDHVPNEDIMRPEFRPLFSVADKKPISVPRPYDFGGPSYSF